jgi:hypothetical protein
MPKAEATRYARTLNEISAEQDFDPLTAVAIIHFETHWYPSLVSSDGEDYGLGQVRARYVGGCRSDEDPVNAPSAACIAVKAALRDGATNIRRMGQIIGANKALCKEKTGTMKPEQWLAGYQGYNDPARGRFCKPGEKTKVVLGYYDELVAKLVPKPKVKVKAKPKATPKPAAPAAKRVPGAVASKNLKPAARKR